MRSVLITGSAGFPGRRLTRGLLDAGGPGDERIGRLVLACVVPSDWPARGGAVVVVQKADRSAPGFVAEFVGEEPDSLFHLAALPMLGAERDPARAVAASVAALRQLIIGARSVPRVVFASSIAIHGRDLPDEVGDDLNQLPTKTHGTHKTVSYRPIAHHSRHGRIEGPVTVRRLAPRGGPRGGGTATTSGGPVRTPRATRSRSTSAPTRRRCAPTWRRDGRSHPAAPHHAGRNLRRLP